MSPSIGNLLAELVEAGGEDDDDDDDDEEEEEDDEEEDNAEEEEEEESGAENNTNTVASLVRSNNVLTKMDFQRYFARSDDHAQIYSFLIRCQVTLLRASGLLGST